MRIRRKFGWMVVAVVAMWGSGALADEKVARAWKSKCGSCHGVDGKGATTKGKKMGIGDMTVAAWQTEFTDAKITETIRKGISREKDGKQQDMDAVDAKDLDDAAVKDLIAHIRTLKK